MSQPAPPLEPEKKVPTLFIAVGLVVALILGILWTRHHQAAKKDLSADDMINEINNKGANLRRQLREEQAAIRRAQSRAEMTAAAINTPKLPADIDESKIHDLIERCSYFQDRVTVDIPKSFQANLAGFTVRDYPALPIAVAQHLVEFDPPSFSLGGATRYLPDPVHPGDTIKVNVVTYAYSKVDVVDEGNVYRFGLGRRRIEVTRVTPVGESQLSVAFQWTFDQEAGADLAPEKEDRKGNADLRRTADGWTLQSVFRQTRSGSSNIRCE